MYTMQVYIQHTHNCTISTADFSVKQILIIFFTDSAYAHQQWLLLKAPCGWHQRTFHSDSRHIPGHGPVNISWLQEFQERISCRFGRQGDWDPTCWQTAHFLYTSHILCCEYSCLNIRSDYIHLENQQSRELISAQRSHTQQQQRSEPTETLTWHVSKYMVHKVHQRYILKKDVHNNIIYGDHLIRAQSAYKNIRIHLLHTPRGMCAHPPRYTHPNRHTHPDTTTPSTHTHTHTHTIICLHATILHTRTFSFNCLDA